MTRGWGAAITWEHVDERGLRQACGAPVKALLNRTPTMIRNVLGVNHSSAGVLAPVPSMVAPRPFLSGLLRSQTAPS